MKTKLQCCSVFAGVALFATMIMVSIFFQSEMLHWARQNPLYMVGVVASIMGSGILITLLLVSFKKCPEKDRCPNAFRGFSHARMKKGKK